MSKLNEAEESMSSRRVSKSEEEFLKEFEAELAGEDLDDFWNNFGNAMMEPEDELNLDDVEEAEGNPLDVFTMDMPVEKTSVAKETSSDSFSLGGVDLGALLNEASGGGSTFEEESVQKVEESIPFMEEAVSFTEEASPFAEDVSPFAEDVSPFAGAVSPFDEAVSPFDEPVTKEESSSGDEMGDVFASLFGDNTTSENENPFDENVNIEIPQAAPAEGLDLSNLGEADLMSLLAGDDGLSDIGNMLSSDGDADFGDEDAFAAFAEGEMAAQDAEEEPEEEEDSKKKKKKKKAKKKKAEKKPGKPGGFMGKLNNLLNFLLKESDGKEEIDLDEFNAITPDMLADENAEILAAFANLEDKSEQAQSGKKKKEKKKKEKKEKKEKKPKKEKPKKEKKPKEPKPKKEKKPKPVDNTPPLPRGPVLIIWVMVISLFALVMLSVNLFSYSSAVSAAKSYHNNGEYAAAYSELVGITIKEKDMMLFNQVATLAAVDSELNAFDTFLLAEKHQEALDSLVCAAGRCVVNADNAEVYECQGQMQILQAEVTNKLHENYGMTYEEAIEIYESRSRDDYSIALVEKLRSLGLVE